MATFIDCILVQAPVMSQGIQLNSTGVNLVLYQDSHTFLFCLTNVHKVVSPSTNAMRIGLCDY